MSKEAYVSFKVAELLKDKGFNWECRSFYEYFSSIITMYQGMLPELSEAARNYNKEEYRDICSRPTQQMAMRWLREEHDTMIIPNRDKIVDVAPEPFYDYYCIIRYNGYEYWVSSLDLPEGQHYTEYEDAVEAALEYVLTNLI